MNNFNYSSYIIKYIDGDLFICYNNAFNTYDFASFIKITMNPSVYSVMKFKTYDAASEFLKKYLSDNFEVRVSKSYF